MDANQESTTSLTRLQILQKSSRGEEIADADFLLRGPGELIVRYGALANEVDISSHIR